MHIAICIATYKRPKLLANLLFGLSQLTFERMPEPRIEIIVADNDVSGSAKLVCGTTITRWPVTYCVESRRGIAQARNCALKQVGRAEFVCFIDDDETPDLRWLEELLLALEQYQADVVSGPVLPSFSDDVPDWVKQDGYFEPPNYETGQVIEWCATNNALVARRVFDLVPQFDERFQLSGADDMHFFGRVSRAGFKIVWSRKAKVSEVIAADRANLGWILRRSYRGGNCSVLVASALDRRITPKLIRFLKATGRIVQGISETGTALFRGKVQLARSLRHVYLGFGMLAGLVDLKYQAYKITTGE